MKGDRSLVLYAAELTKGDDAADWYELVLYSDCPGEQPLAAAGSTVACNGSQSCEGCTVGAGWLQSLQELLRKQCAGVTGVCVGVKSAGHVNEVVFG